MQSQNVRTRHIIVALNMEGTMWEEMWVSGNWWQSLGTSQQGNADLRPSAYNLEPGSANNTNELTNRVFGMLPEPSQHQNVMGFPGRLVMKSPPNNAGDMGLIPDPGRSHIPQSN